LVMSFSDFKCGAVFYLLSRYAFSSLQSAELQSQRAACLFHSSARILTIGALFI
jgi:hypothetical protein